MHPKNEKGFTLIELLVVIAIIGILAAIAIPQFASYRTSAFCARVESDVANAMVAAEGYFAANQSYPADSAAAGFEASPGVNLAFTAGPPFVVTGDSADCDKGTYSFTQGSAPSWGAGG